MTLAQQKHVLRVACTLDRLQLVLLTRPPRGRATGLAAIVESPWFEIARHAVVQFFPRKLRLLGAIVHSWLSRQSG